MLLPHVLFVFFFNDTATTEIYTLSLHDALPILRNRNSSNHGGGENADVHERPRSHRQAHAGAVSSHATRRHRADRKSTRLNSSHANISYAVFCLKKKNTN